MNILIYQNNGAKPRNININPLFVGIGTVVLGAALVVGGAFLGYRYGDANSPMEMVNKWSSTLAEQDQKLNHLREDASANVNALAARIGKLQAHVTRVDAFGARLLDMAKLDKREFDFSQTPAVGGPEEGAEVVSQNLDSLEKSILQLESEINLRELQLSVIERAITEDKLQEAVSPQGRPVKQGWVSSRYGWRTNPFGGNREFHSGVDIAARENTEVLAVGGGVVTWSGSRYGYGNLVEITHSNGYVTRYGHNKENIVRVGQAVKKGDAIARVGSTGRSTGPHVHFEVLKDGKKIDPSDFMSAN